MKILLMGDASGYHATLAEELRLRGHEVVLASDGGVWMHTASDISLRRPSGKLGGAWLWMRLNSGLRSKLRGFDIVQLSGCGFLKLRPARIDKMFDRLRRDNGLIYLTVLDNDTPYVDLCTRHDSPLPYNEWMVDGVPTPYSAAHPELAKAWLTEPLKSHCEHIYSNIDGAISALYEYHLSVAERLGDKAHYAGIPIQCGAAVSLQRQPWEEGTRPLRILAACHRGREMEKGFDRMMPIVERVALDRPRRVTIERASNIPKAEFGHLLGEVDIVIDQLYSLTPGTTALMAMAAGAVAVTGGDDRYYDFIDEPVLRPVISARLDTLYDDLIECVDNTAIIHKKSAEGREFVKRHNDAATVAQRFIDVWNK